MSSAASGSVCNDTKGCIAIACMAAAVPFRPTRPATDLPKDHCIIPGMKYSHVPMKHRAELALPPMPVRRTMARCRSEGGVRRCPRAAPCASSASAACLFRGGSTAGSRRPCSASKGGGRDGGAVVGGIALRRGGDGGGVAACHGIYCGQEIRYPDCMLDIASSDDPWSKQARLLMGRRTMPLSDGEQYPVFTPDEILVRSEEPVTPPGSDGLVGGGPSAATAMATAEICLSWILEAHSHPSLCRWLQEEAGWMFDCRSPEQLSEAARRIQQDDAAGSCSVSTLMDKSKGGARSDQIHAPGLHYRLQAVPVCNTCLSIYGTVHSVVRQIRVQRRDLWAERMFEKRREKEAKERAGKREDVFEECLSRRRQEDPDSTSLHHKYKVVFHAGSTKKGRGGAEAR